MPVVRMQDHISGGRWDGREWPPAYGEIEVPDWEARDLIAGHLAVPVGSGTGSSAAAAPQAEIPAPPEPGAGASATSLPGRPPAPVPPPEVSPVAEVSPLAGAPETAAAPEPRVTPEPEPEPVTEMDLAAEMDMELETDERGLAEPPAPHDIKQKWIDYAVLCGENPDTARDMTKADLMSKYGGRL